MFDAVLHWSQSETDDSKGTQCEPDLDKQYLHKHIFHEKAEQGGFKNLLEGDCPR